MSDSIIGKENISYRKKRIAETSQSVPAIQTIQFAHKFVGGETSFSLLNLTNPSSEMPGFTNPSPAVLAGTGLNVNPSALRLYVSMNGGRLIPFSEFRALGTTIVFLGTIGSLGMPAGAFVFGEIDAIAPNPIVVGDGRFVRKSYSLAVGVTTLNLGFSYKVGVNLGSGDQIGDIKVYRNGVIQCRNAGNATASPSADGNYQEINSGSGYGTTIVFNTAPVGQADSIIVEMGYQISSGQLQIWSELERLQGALLSLATDASSAFGNPIANYISANATELERKGFGDLVLSLRNRVDALETISEVSTGIPAFQTASTNYIDVPGSTLIVPSGVWDLTFQGLVAVTATGAVSNLYAQVAILNTANEIVDGASSLCGGSIGAAGQALIFPTTLTARRVPAGTYRLSVRSNSGGAGQTLSIGGQDYTGSLSGDDSRNIFWARRIV